MRNLSKLGTLGLSLFATVAAMPPLHAANTAAAAAKGSAHTKQLEQRGDQEFCARFQPVTSRIVRQGCKTKAGWESIGIELLIQK